MTEKGVGCAEGVPGGGAVAVGVDEGHGGGAGGAGDVAGGCHACYFIIFVLCLFE